LILKKLSTVLLAFSQTAFFLLFLHSGMYGYLFAEKGIIYDPEKGIIFTDEKKQQSSPSPKKNATIKNTTSSTTIKPTINTNVPSKKEDIHINRKKDPPEIYFKSGLEYFKNEDYSNALKNFTYADSLSSLPLYKLWKAKTLRHMSRYQPMLILLEEITTTFENSDLADDALLELAIYYKSINDYEKSLQTLTRLVEQYPFGISSTNGEELPEIARNQRRLIRQEMINSLAILGYKIDDLSSSCRQFQNENGLTVTGNGTPETITLIKKMHNQVILEQELKSNKSKQFAKYKWLVIFSFSILIITASLLFVLRIKIQSRKKQLRELKNTLIELDTGKL
jgi:tetratricopeptide (TPR) repeat protein